MNDRLTVKADNYVSRFHFLDKDLLRFDRIHRFVGPTKEVDSLPRIWSLALADFEPGIIRVPTENGPAELVGPVGVFMPPFSPIQWQIEPSVLEFRAFISPTSLPPGIPRDPFFFSWAGNQDPTSVDEILALLTDLQNLTYIKPPGRYSVPAQMTKIFIDNNYHQRISLAEMAKQLNYSHSFLTRSFKSTYGISPVEYRTRLRLFDAQMLLLTKSSKVTHVAYASGFSDPGRFMKQFRRLFRARPSQFRIKRGLEGRDLGN
ncbi:MAG: helix-turn-helix transcriptional regulator [Bdellovibrionaceae bacterium]|nr:helix-turn-helix transcriptional regulator [Bdellovibrionales bacterium]MCB9083951.1 helix-turn-helix transcriptional regulator [Pseudobdellovibrionaceae bacterium]